MGISGAARAATLELVAAAIPTDITPTWPPEFESPLDARSIEAVARAVPERGGTDDFDRIAFWGAALCWLTADAPTSEILKAAAAFNAGVAAFDSVVGRHSGSLSELTEALAPAELRRVVQDPDERLGEVSDDHAPVVALFQVALSTFGARWRRHSEQLSLGCDLLERMYRSELGLSSAPWSAKTLPTVFAGLLGTDDPIRIEFHRALGRFLADWDDWMDLDEDLVRLAPNRHLCLVGQPHLGGHVSRAIAMATSERARQRVRQRLRDDLAEVFAAADRAGSPVAERTSGFACEMLS